jgi:hypothetical protein
MAVSIDRWRGATGTLREGPLTAVCLVSGCWFMRPCIYIDGLQGANKNKFF